MLQRCLTKSSQPFLEGFPPHQLLSALQGSRYMFTLEAFPSRREIVVVVVVVVGKS